MTTIRVKFFFYRRWYGKVTFIKTFSGKDNIELFDEIQNYVTEMKTKGYEFKGSEACPQSDIS